MKEGGIIYHDPYTYDSSSCRSLHGSLKDGWRVRFSDFPEVGKPFKAKVLRDMWDRWYPIVLDHIQEVKYNPSLDCIHIVTRYHRFTICGVIEEV